MEYAAETYVPRDGRVEGPPVEVRPVEHADEDQGEVEVVGHVAEGVPLEQGETDAGVVVVGVLVHNQRDEGDRRKEREEEHEHDVQRRHGGLDGPHELPRSARCAEGEVGVEEQQIVRQLDKDIGHSTHK